MRKGDIWLLLPDMAELRKGSSSFPSSLPFSSSSASALMHPRIPWVFLGFPPTGTSAGWVDGGVFEGVLFWRLGLGIGKDQVPCFCA